MASKKQNSPKPSKKTPASPKSSPSKSAKPTPKQAAPPKAKPQAPAKAKPAPPKPVKSAPAPKTKTKPEPKSRPPKPKAPVAKTIQEQILATVVSGSAPKIPESASQPQAEIEILQIEETFEADLQADEPVGQPTAEIREMAEVGEVQALQDPHELESAIEAILFASPEPIPVKKIAEALEGPDAKVIKEALERISKKYEERRGGMQVVEVQGGWRMGTHERHSEIIYRLGSRKKRQALSPATLETLAIIAYRQPIIRAQIETIRGVECSGTIRNLLDLALIEITGYKEVIGRPALYGTTPRFLTTFGLRSLTDLPSIRGLKEQLKQREAEEAQREMEARAKSEAEARAQAEAASQAMADAGIIAAETEEKDEDEDELVEGEEDIKEVSAGDGDDDTDDYDDEDEGDEYDDDDEEDDDEGDDEEEEEDDEDDEDLDDDDLDDEDEYDDEDEDDDDEGDGDEDEDEEDDDEDEDDE